MSRTGTPHGRGLDSGVICPNDTTTEYWRHRTLAPLFGRILHCRMNPEPSLCFGMAKFIVSLLLIVYAAPLSAQTLEIRLVDGRTGRPMVDATSYVNVWVGTERKEAIAIPTDANGIARLQLTLDTGQINIPKPSKDRGSIVVANPVVMYNEAFRVNAPYALCASGGSNYSWLKLESFSTSQILQHGYVSPNTCGKAKASPKPGQVTLFVRALTWREKLKQ